MNLVVFFLNLMAAPFEFLFCIPVVGRAAKWIWNSIWTFAHFVFGMIEYGLMSLGFKPQKKMRINVVLFRDQDGTLLADIDDVVERLQHAINIFQSAANVRLLPASGIPNQLASDGHHSLANEGWVYTPKNSPGSFVLDLACNLPAALQDFWLTGMLFQFMITTWFFSFNFRRMIGYGAPITVFIVRGIKNYHGCSMGPFTDYVTIHHKHLVCMPHEFGHACNLIHSKDITNLMYPSASGATQLTRWQIALIRASRHVTFL